MGIKTHYLFYLFLSCFTFIIQEKTSCNSFRKKVLMIKKESTKLGYIADYKKDVDDIISLLQTFPDNAEMKRNFLSSVLEMVGRTYDISTDYDCGEIEDFEKIIPNKFKELSKNVSPELEDTFWGCLYAISKNLGSENEAKNLILKYIEDKDFEEVLKELGTDFHSLFVDIRETYYNASVTDDEHDPDPDNSVELDVLYEDFYELFSNYYLAFRKEDLKFFFLDCDYDKNYPNFLPPGSHIVLDIADFLKEEVSDFWFETSLFKLIFLLPITEDFSNINIFSNSVGNIMLETLSKLSAENLFVSNDYDLIGCVKCGEIPLYPELRDLVPDYPEDAYPEHLYKNI